MGDRACICVKHGQDPGIYFYSHWGGCNLPRVLQAAMKRGESRWGDSSYLARIIFCEMIQDDVLGTTGYGISSNLSHTEHPGIYVYCPTLEIRIRAKTWSFEEYIALDISQELGDY